MRPIGSHDETRARGLDLKTHSRFAARSQEARRTMNSAEMTSTGNGLQHPHSENDDG